MIAVSPIRRPCNNRLVSGVAGANQAPRAVATAMP
jgi:hypothetical protein